jgi:hypothetical protein
MTDLRFTAELWEYDGNAAWCFVTVPPDTSEDLRLSGAEPAGFGSIKVEVSVGASTWRTSVFPDKASGGFVLPVKKAIRKAEDIEVGDEMAVSIEPIL